jgi:hypothetical protein
MGFTIVHPRVNLEIKLEAVDHLVVHEKILENYLSRLIVELKSDKCLMHPVVVDRKSLVVLDGMHRMAAARELGWRVIPVCLLDYNNSNVSVRSWYRLINPRSDIEQVTRAIEELGFGLKERSLDDACDLIEKREAMASLVFASKCYSIHGGQETIKAVYDAINEIELKLSAEGYSVGYETESDARSKMASGEAFFMLMVPPVSKEEVVKAALSGQIFSHKTTRHVLPLRPLFINLPFDWLYSTSNLDTLNEKLVKHLSAKSFVRLPPGQILDRRYEEELYVFKDGPNPPSV